MKHLFAPLKTIGRAFVVSLALVCGPLLGWAQSGKTGAPPALPANATLEECVQFALRNQPLVRQSLLDEAIGERQIRIGLSDWLPQVQGVGSYTRNLILPAVVLPNFQDPAAGQQIVRIGLNNTSTIGVQGTQLLYSNDVLLAARSRRFVRLRNSQNTTNFKIDVVTNVSKAFYDILLTQEQLRILDEAIVRQEKQLKDAFAQYEVGITDKIDYKRATISVKNAYAQRKTTAESLKGKYATLKQLMGYAPENNLALTYDTAQMIQQTRLDTTQQLAFEKRIEVQQLLTQKKLQRLNTDYYRLGFLPTLSGFINYNRVYQNNEFSVLYDRAFPNSQAGVQLALPIFQGTRRLQNLKIAELQEERVDLDLFDTKNQINSEYEQALATYKSALNDLATQQENARDAEEIYNIVKLQYDEGIKTYLEVIVAETDLRTSQLNYYNSLFNVLASKLDVERALGVIALN
ncbi:TolC family protein [Hymenobacter sp. HD11105]